MKKTILLTLAIAAVLVYAPSSAQAFSMQGTEDANISEVSAAPTASIAGETETYTIAVTTNVDLPSGSTISIFSTEDDGPEYVNLQNVVPSSEGSIGNSNFIFSPVLDGRGTVLTLSAKLPADKYTVTLADAVNPDEATSIRFGVTTQPLSESANATMTDDTVSIQGLGNAVGSLSVSPTEATAGSTLDLELYFTLSRGLSSGEELSIVFVAENKSPSESGWDLTDATIDNSKGTLDEILTYDLSQNSVLSCEVLTDVAKSNEDAYDLLISDAVAGIAGAHSVAMTTDGAADSAEDYALANFTINELTAPSKIKKKKHLKVKKKKKKSAKLWWKAKANADTYQAVLQKKKANGKFTSVKKFKGLTTNSKFLKKSKKFVKSKQYYRFRVRCGNDAGWSKWSPWKKFRMK